MKKTLRFVKKNKYIFLLIIIAIVTHLLWFDFTSLLFHGDWRKWPSENLQRFIFGGYGTYIDDIGFGSQNIQVYFNFVFFLWGVIGHYMLATRLTLFIPIAILSVLSPYLLVKELTKNEKIAFVCALFFAFSTTLLSTQLSHLFIGFVFALSPLVLLLFIKLVNNFNTKNVLLFSMVYSLGCFYELRIMFIVSLILVLYSFMFFKLKDILKNKLKFLLLIFLILSVNSFWILPTIFSDKSAMLSISNRGLFGDQFFDLFYSFANSDVYWTGGEYISFIKQPISVFTWIVPVLAFSLILVFRKISVKDDKKHIIFFSMLALLGIFLTKQSAEPFRGIYSFLYNHFLGFNLYREASKFFILVLLGYLGLFAYSLKYLVVQRRKIKNHYKTVILLFFSIIFLLNAIPLVTGKIGWVFVKKTEPHEYKVFNEFIKNQEGFFRTAWVPVDSQWAYYNQDKPKISLESSLYSDYKELYDKESIKNKYADFILNPFQKDYGEYLAAISSIKYFIVPLNDDKEQQKGLSHFGSKREDYIKQLDDISFLKEVRIDGLNDLKVYENPNYKPYIFTLDKVFNVGYLGDVNKKSAFVEESMGQELNYFLSSGSKTKDLSPLIGLMDIFEDPSSTSIDSDESTIQKSFETNSKSLVFYNNTQNKEALYYRSQGSEMEIYTKNIGRLNLNGNLLGSDNTEKTLATVGIADDLKYILSVNDELYPLDINKQGQFIGVLSSDDEVKIFRIDDQNNSIANFSLEDGLWQEKVGDCHNYDNNPDIGMKLNEEEKSDGKYSLQLEATRHTACTSKDVTVKGGSDYLLSFDYQGPNAKEAGYYIDFNDEKKSSINERIEINDENRHTYTKNIKIPDGATTASLTFYAYETDGKTKNVVRYDKVKMIKMDIVNDIRISNNERGITKTELPPNEKNLFEFFSENYKMDNILQNPSFEDGLWQEKVGDCHNYDDHPKIGMKRLKKADGRYSLQLEATRHTACTSKDVTVKGGSDYLLSFDYQGSNAKEAGYYISFDDEKKSSINERIEINDENRHTYTKNIKIPDGATTASLTFYAYETDGKTKNVVRYDNVSVRMVPPLNDTYYLLAETAEKISNPERVEYELVNPTKKNIHIKGASNGFFLVLNEKYNPEWKLYINNSKVEGFLKSWSPFARPDSIEENRHYELNNLLNVWYVDIDELAKKGLITQKSDGSYDIEMVSEFRPQRFFYLGTIISFLGLGCLVMLLVKYRKKNEAV